MEGDIVKVTKKGKVSKTSQLEVPQRLELEARMLIEPAQHPICSMIEVCLWREQARNCSALVGDAVRVTNVYSSEYFDSISLNSTGRTRVYKVGPVTKGQVVCHCLCFSNR